VRARVGGLVATVLGFGIALTLSCSSKAPSKPGPANDYSAHVDAAAPGPAGPAPIDGGPVGEASVLQGHLEATRAGAYVDPAVTLAAGARLQLDPSFKAEYDGQTYAQPLYLEDLAAGREVLFVVTMTNEVAAVDARTGSPLWVRWLGPLVPPSDMPCNQPPAQSYGILSTPVIDAAARTLFTVALVTPDGGKTKKHMVHALSIDDGNERPGWPVDVQAVVPGFVPDIQHQRGSLLLLGGRLFVPFSGIAYDCTDEYHGRVIGIDERNPKEVTSWATAAARGGVWGGLTSDGESLFFATGNTAAGTTSWGGGEAVVRLPQSLRFSGSTTDYFTPSNWQHLDDNDFDVGSSTLVLFDLPGANPSRLAMAMGKFQVAYLVDRDDLGGVGKGNGRTGEGLFSEHISNDVINGNPATYVTKKGRYVVLRADGPGIWCPNGTTGDLIALLVAPTSPPTFSTAWCAVSQGLGSPMVTTTDGESNPIVWVVSAQGTNQLLGFDGDTGAMVFSGGGVTMTQVLRWTSPVVAKGRFYVGATGKLYAFDAPH
jgi:hypothetical protein